MAAEEMVSMQLFSQKLHLVGAAAKQEIEVSLLVWEKSRGGDNGG